MESPHPVLPQSSHPQGLLIREFNRSDADYEIIVRITNEIYPESPETVASFKERDAKREERIRHRRWLAFLDNEPVGVAAYMNMTWMYDPRKFYVTLNVRPAYRQQGIGKQLYQTLYEGLSIYDPLTLRARYRESVAGAYEFATAYGFEEESRTWESRLPVQDVDLRPFDGLRERLEHEGLRFATLRELMESDPDYQQKIYELEKSSGADVPTPEPLTPLSFEQFVKEVFESKKLFPEAFFIALDGDRYLGLSNLERNSADPTLLFVDYTGVDAAYRRRGIGLALKVEAIKVAQAHGFTTISTWNDSTNKGMLAINNMLGFIRQPAWIDIVKHYGATAPTKENR